MSKNRLMIVQTDINISTNKTTIVNQDDKYFIYKPEKITGN